LDGGPSGPVSQLLPIPIGGTVVPLEIGRRSNSSTHYLYTLRSRNNETLQTQNTTEAEIGSCIRLWHAPRSSASAASAASPDYNFIAGTMEVLDQACN
jgi:hypothetical protein